MADTIGIVGGGALGTLLASRLLDAGAPVRAVVRSETRREALRRDYPSLDAGSDFDLLRGCGIVFLCVKAYDTEEVARSLGGLKLRETVVCSLQNGWSHMEVLAAALPGVPLLAAATSMGAFLDERDALRATGRGQTLVAPWRAGDLPRAQEAVEILRRAGLSAEPRPDARAVLWRKLTVNSAVNPVTALARCVNGALLEERPLLRVAERAAAEAARVGWKLKVLDPSFDPGGTLRSVLQETSGNRSSMMEDLTRGRRTEIEEIVGAVVRLANETRVRAPVQEALLTLVRAAEDRLKS
jgi:2-dehydropantoate 2-reductase